jgi:predicted RNA methylase
LPETAPASAESGRPPRGRPVHLSGYERAGQDFYATPEWVTAALLRHVRLRGPVWEPCCGDGAMARVMTADGHSVFATDIADRGFGEAGVDFLECREVPGGCRSIVTNPPYGDSGSHEAQSRSPAAMREFLSHALMLTESVQGQLALLVRLQWIAGRRVAGVMSAAPFSAVIVLTRRIRWFDMGEKTNHAQHHHAWVVFDHAHPRGRPPAMLYG